MISQLTAFVVLVLACAALLGGTAALTRERVEENRHRQFLEMVRELAPGDAALPPIRWTDDVWPLCGGTLLVRGAAAGYGGPIRWLAAVSPQGGVPHIAGVRVTAHQETPGIVDFLDAGSARDGWLARLRGRSTVDVLQINAVSGATITSRALLRDLARALERPRVLGRTQTAPEPGDCNA